MVKLIPIQLKSATQHTSKLFRKKKNVIFPHKTQQALGQGDDKYCSDDCCTIKKHEFFSVLILKYTHASQQQQPMNTDY